MQLTGSLQRTPALPLLLRFIRLEVGTQSRRIARAFGLNRPLPLDLDAITVPDSQVVQQATDMVQACSPPFLLNHCLRTYFFGVAIGKHLQLKPDLEVFYLGAIMHDLGVTEKHDGEATFELNGARAAHGFLQTQAYPGDRAALVHEAIALHTSVGIAGRREAEIALVYFSAGLDVIGFNAENVARPTIDTIVARYPRLGFMEKFSALLADQARRKPDCPVAGHFALGFARKIQEAPFSE